MTLLKFNFLSISFISHILEYIRSDKIMTTIISVAKTIAATDGHTSTATTNVLRLHTIACAV